MINKEKQIYSWWINSDTDIHCVCGKYIQIFCELVNEDQEIICENCGQRWFASIDVHMIEELENDK